MAQGKFANVGNLIGCDIVEIGEKLLKQLTEAKYLCVENSWRYRSIIRFFYMEYEKMNYWLYKEDVLGALISSERFKDYTVEQCRQDLDALCEWGNLVPVQDTSKAMTIEEFKNKQFRYQLSPYSVEIERMVIRLENLKVENASLEPTLLERLKMEIEKFEYMSDKTPQQVGIWWNNLNEDFKRLNQNYQDYIRELCSIRAEELMKSREFLIFKDKFIEYIRSFVKGLQTNSYAIESVLKSVGEECERAVFDKVIEYEMSIPRIENIATEQEMMESISGRWHSIKRWFLGQGAHESEASRLFETTNDIIRKITRFACQIIDTKNSLANRKEEYKKLAEMFVSCNEIDDAHKISSLVFGLFSTRHIRGDIERQSESTSSSVYDEAALEVTIKPRVRTFREKAVRNAISENEDRKRLMREKIMAQRLQEAEILREIVNGNEIDFESLGNIEPHIRNTLLKWVAKGNSSKSRRAKTDEGASFELVHPEDGRKCTLECSDGKFITPAYKIRFEG